MGFVTSNSQNEKEQRSKTNLVLFCLLTKNQNTPTPTIFMSMPLVYVHACWKYSSSLCLSGLGIWWKRMNSLTRSIWRWYLAVPEYNLWMMADTFPKMLAYIRAGKRTKHQWYIQVGVYTEGWISKINVTFGRSTVTYIQWAWHRWKISSQSWYWGRRSQSPHW